MRQHVHESERVEQRGVGALLIAVLAAAVVGLVVVAAHLGRDAAPGSIAPTSGPTSTPPAIPSLGDAFNLAYRAATGNDAAIQWRESVAYLVDGRQVATLNAAEAGNPAGWPAPLPTVLTRLAETGTTLVIESGMPKRVGCDRVSLPVGIARRRAVTIRPDTNHRDCFSDFAVTLFLDESQRVSAVSVVLSGP